MALDTAVFYDIENLVGGYRNLDASELSLREIHQAILDVGVDGIAIQRAYANWSDARLNILRGDIVELGIEPVQMFGFGRGQQKNASDIQLAIDAVEIAIRKVWVEQFVIVSGDGGFAFLAKKLHEFGKTVVGCAYQRVTNRVFESVCDRFVWLEEPDEPPRTAPSRAGGGGGGFQPPSELTNPIVRAFARSHQPVANASLEEVLKQAAAVIEFLEAEPSARSALSRDGMNISILAELLAYGVPEFHYLRYGFERLVDFVTFVTRSSKLVLMFRPPSEYRLVFRGTPLRGFVEVAAGKKPEDLQSARFYRNVLERSYPGYPRYRIPPVDVLDTVIRCLCERKGEFNNLPSSTVVEKLEALVEWDQPAAKDAVLLLVAADCFLCTPEDKGLADQMLSFRLGTHGQVLDLLKQRFLQKLTAVLGNADEDLLVELIPAEE